MKLAAVTGASSGIGAAAARALASRGFHVIAAGRSERRTTPTVGQIIAAGGSAEFLHLDLSRLDSCRNAAAEFIASGRRLEVLVNNAGVGPVKGLTQDGYEIHFGVNHLGHFLLTRQLEEAFSADIRLVQVSSQMHHRVDRLDFETVTSRTKSFFGLQEYAASKLANILFVREMARRHPDVRAYAVHPGLVKTNIIPRYVRPFISPLALTPEQGADTIVWCATAPETLDESGLYYARRAAASPSAAALDDDLANRLWDYSSKACGLT